VAGWVRKLQQDGHGVLVLSAREAEALAAADVGVAVMTRADGVAWQADLIGTGLADGWRVLQAVGAARQASRRAAQLSAGGSGLGALLTTTRTQRRGRARVAPVHSAALAAMISGLTGARAVARAPGPAPIPRGDWHAMEPDAVLARLRADRAPPDGQDDSPSASVSASAPPETTGPAFWGLPATLGRGKAVIGAAARQKAVASVVTGPASGLAELAGAVRHELQDPLTPVLAFGAMASAAVSSGVDAALVAGVMAGNALISGVERMRAERSLGRLLREERLTGRRLAGDPGGPGGVPAANDLTGLATGPSVTVPASELRPGDIIALAPPDLVPADARLLTADDLELDESPLTGESLPVGKTTSPVPGAPLTERACMVYQGSTVLAGRGLAVVTASGEATEAGQAAMAAGRGTRPTGIQAHLAELTRISVPASGLGGLAVTGLGLLHRVPLREAIASGIAVAVAAVPEGLPLVATAAQLAAARRLTRTGVLVRSSRALEALGRVDVICFDKTGTLTQGRLAVTKLAAPDRTASPGPAHGRHLLQVGARACPQWDGDGALAHATDRAVLEAARERAGGDRDWEPAEELPFEASRGYSASLGRSAGRAQLAVKGAPEVVLPRCNRIALAGHAAETASAPMTPARRRAAQAVLHELTSQGLRVLAVAETSLPGAPGSYHLGGNGNGRAAPGDPDELATGLTLTGFLGIADTVRPSALATVRALAGAGVRVTMITGDHPGTAMAIARQLGIPHPGRVLTGPEFSRLPEDARIRRIADAAVIARVSPEQKVRIVQALQQAGHVVAMTGDGVNDAAAIRLADVGIGVTTRGSAPARSAADLVLTDSDTSHILEALAEGRTLWDRVRDAVSILVGGNAGEVAFTLLGTAASGRSPLNTRQLLLVNTLTDMLPALAVALSPASASRTGDTSALLAAGPVAPFLGPDLGRALAVRGGATALGATMAWQAGRFTGRRRRASTMGLATLVLTQLGQTLLTGERGPLTLATSAASAGVLAAIVETPGVSQFFGCSPLGPVAWTIVTGSTATGVLAAALAPRVFPATPVHPPPAPAHPDRE
jgi:cation-transporting ATPase I